jgi:hypothetical protein
MTNHIPGHILLGTLIILLASAAAVRAQSSTDEKATDKTTKGTITGQVVNESGQSLPNALVTIRGYGGNEGQTLTTDAEGKFQATDLAPIAYLISVSAPAYVSKPRDPDVNPIGYYRVGDSVQLEMMKGGVITGSVTRANGEPVVSINVNVYMLRDYKGQPPRYSRPTRSQLTDDRGIYRIYGLPPGTYIVAAGAGDVSSYNVNPFATDAPTFAPSSTRDGAAEITVNAGDEVSSVDIRYRGESGHTVSGTASSTAGAQRGFQIVLSSVVNGLEQVGYDTYQSPVSRGFMISGVADGEYQMTAQTYSPEGSSISEPVHIKVSGADITGIDLTVTPLASINGSVVLEESKVTECQGKHRPVLGEIVVGAYHNEKNTAKDHPQFVWGLGGPVTPEPQGTFRLSNLAAGQYRFVTRPLAKYWYLKSITWPAASKPAQANQPLDAARNWTSVKMGDNLSGLTITFALGAASLQGRIENPSGKMLPRTFVYLAPAEPEKREDILRYFAALAESDGTFAVSNVPPGRYWVLARAAAETDSNMFSKLRLPDESELRAKILHDGESAKTATEFKPCQNVTDYRVPLRTMP